MKRTLDLYKVIHSKLWSGFDGLINFCPNSSDDYMIIFETNVTAYWRDPHLEEVNLRYMQQQTRSEIVHIACRIGNENCATQVNRHKNYLKLRT